MSNLSAVLVKPGQLRLEDTPIPEPKRGEIQIAIRTVGICGTDLHYFAHGGFGDVVMKQPLIPGHESCGIVTKLGEGVTHLKVGDRVGIEPGPTCRNCELCYEGRYNLCPDIKPLGMPPYDGTLRRFYVHPADLCIKMPDHVTDDEGAMLEPLSCVIHACRRGRITFGQKVLVCGSGPIGLLAMLTAKAMGACVVTATDVDQSRLDMAKKIGADHVILVKPGVTPRSIADEIVRAMGKRADVTLECSGVESSLQTALFATRTAGVLVLVGIGKDTVNFPIVDAATREIDIVSGFGHAHSYTAGLEMIASGAIDVKPLISHHFPLEKVSEAYETAKNSSGGAMKIIITCATD